MRITLRRARNRAAPTVAAIAPSVEARPPSAWSRTFTALEIPEFRRLWIGTLLSMVGMQMMNVAQPWLAYHLSGSGLALGAVAAAGGIPMLHLAPIGGAVADRYDKRKILMCTQASLAISTGLIAALVYFDVITVWLLGLLAFWQGATFPFNMPARQSYIPALVTGPRMPNALALDSTGAQLNHVLAPSVGGILLAWSPTVAFSVAAIAFIIAMYLIFRLPGTTAVRAGTGLLRDAFSGFTYVARRREVLILLLVAMVVTILGLPYVQFLPVFQAEVLHVGTSSLGFMFAINGLGALFGALSAAYLAGSPLQKRVLVLSGMGLGVSLVLFAISTQVALSLAMLFVVGFMQQSYLTTNRMALILNTEPAYYGRVISFYLVTFALTPLAALPLGALVDSAGPATTIALVGAVLVVFIAAVGSFLPAPRRSALLASEVVPHRPAEA